MCENHENAGHVIPAFRFSAFRRHSERSEESLILLPVSHSLSNPRVASTQQSSHVASLAAGLPCPETRRPIRYPDKMASFPRFGLLFLRTETSLQEKVLPISQELLDLLVCPVCKTPVTLTPKGEGLRCAKCRLMYPIRDGFPIMIRDEAIMDGPSQDETRPESPKS